MTYFQFYATEQPKLPPKCLGTPLGGNLGILEWPKLLDQRGTTWEGVKFQRSSKRTATIVRAEFRTRNAPIQAAKSLWPTKSPVCPDQPTWLAMPILPAWNVPDTVALELSELLWEAVLRDDADILRQCLYVALVEAQGSMLDANRPVSQPHTSATSTAWSLPMSSSDGRPSKGTERSYAPARTNTE